MAEEKVLEQAEIDALVRGVDSGSINTQSAPVTGEVRPFDFREQLSLLKGRLPTLAVVNERLVRLLRASFYQLLRRSAEITMKDVEMHKFGDYLNKVTVPTSLNLVKFNPLRGAALIALEPQLVLAVVDSFFGGTGRLAQAEDREFTASEQRIIHMILRNVFEDLREAWAPVASVEVEYLQSETNPQYAAIVAPSEVVVLMSCHVELEGGGGNLQILMPYSMLEPLRDVLEAAIGAERTEKDERWSARLHHEIEDAEVELKTFLGHSSVTLAGLLNLKPGDVLPCDFNGKVLLLADDVPLFRGSFGLSRGQQAIKVERALRHV
jgi:flagellar motor switch protein FliM